MANNEDSESKDTEALKLGGIGAELQFSPDLGVQFRGVNFKVANGSPLNLLGLSSSHELIRIDGVLVKGMTLEEMTALLRGPVGSEVEIEVKQFLFEVLERFKLTRVEESQETRQDPDQYSAFQKTLAMTDKIFAFNSNDFATLAAKRRKLNDFEIAEALYRMAVERAVESANLASAEMKLSYLASIGRLFISIGDFESVIETSKKMLDYLSSGVQHAQTNLELNRFLDQLTSIDEERSELLLIKLIDTCKGKKIGTHPYTGLQYKLAQLLTERKRFEEAREIINGHLGAEPDKNLYPNHPDLSIIGDLLRLQGDLSGASAMFELAIQKYDKYTTEPSRTFEKARPVSVLLRKLIVTHLQNNDRSSALECIARSIAIYDEVFEDNELIRLEQRLGFFPAFSDVLKLAGDVFTLSQDLDQGKAYYERALALREKALGSSNPLVLEIRDAISSQLSEQKRVSLQELEITVFSDYQHGLKKIPEKSILPSEFMAAHKQVHCGQLNEAQTLITQLIEETSSPPPEFISASVTLARTIAPQEPSISLNILKSLALRAAPSSSESLSLLANLGSFATTAGDDKTANANWRRLEQHLDALQPALGTSAAKSANPISLGEKLRCLANVFRINKCYDVAHHLLARSEINGADLIMLLCDRALLAVAEGNVDEGRTLWQRILTLGPPHLTDKLLELEALIEQKRGETSEKDEEELLKAASAAGRDDALLKLAVFYNSKQRYSETEQLIKGQLKPQYSGLPALRKELALSLEKQGKSAEALSLYKQLAACMGGTSPADVNLLKQEILGRALVLEETLAGANSEKLVPLLKALFDSLRSSGKSEEAEAVTQRLLQLTGGEPEPNHETDDPEVLKRLAQQYWQTKQIDKYIDVSRRLAMLHYRSGSIEAAIRSLFTVASSALKKGQVEQALADANLILDWEKSLGCPLRSSDSLQIGGERDGFTSGLIKTNLLVESEKLLHRAIDVRGGIYGHESQEVAMVLTNLVIVQQASNTDFQATLDRIFSIYRAHGGRSPKYSNHFYHIRMALERLATQMADSGDFATAINLLEKLVDVQDRFGPHGTLFATTLSALGSVHTSAGNFDAAESALKGALQIQIDHMGSGHFSVGFLRDKYYTVLQKLGKKDEAEALGMNMRVLPLHHTINAGVDLRKLCNEAKRATNIEESRKLLLEALKIAEGSNGQLSRDCRETVKLLRTSYAQDTERQNEYFDLLLKELNILKQTEGHSAMETISLTLQIANAFKQKGELPASRLWIERARKATAKLHLSNFLEQPEFLKLAEEFAKLSEPECAKNLIEKVLAQVDKQMDLKFGRGMRQQCAALLRRYDFDVQAAEIDEQQKDGNRGN